MPVLGALDDAARFVQRYRVDELVIALPQSAHERLNKLISELQSVPVNIRVVPDYFSLAVFRATVDDFGGLPLISSNSASLMSTALPLPLISPRSRASSTSLSIISTR